MKMDQILDHKDLRYLQSSNPFLNIDKEDIKTIKFRLLRDLQFMVNQDAINYSIQLIVEQGHTLANIPNQFHSKVNGHYTLHICISDFTETYSQQSYLNKLLITKPQMYADRLRIFFNQNVLVSSISRSDRKMEYLEELMWMW